MIDQNKLKQRLGVPVVEYKIDELETLGPEYPDVVEPKSDYPLIGVSVPMENNDEDIEILRRMIKSLGKERSVVLTNGETLCLYRTEDI